MKDERFWLPYTYMTMDHRDMSANIAAVATGTVVAAAVPEIIPKGDTVDRIAFRSGSTAYATLTSQVFALVRAWDRMVLAKTADATSAAWGANTWKSLDLTAPYEFLEDTAVYLVQRVAATTMGTHAGISMLTAESGTPTPAATAGTSAIPAVGSTLAALTAIANIYIAGCS